MTDANKSKPSQSPHVSIVIPVYNEEGILRGSVLELREKLRPFGFTTEIPTLMAASDLVVTASGVTCSEARAVGRALLLIDIVPGHGRENLQYELELGNASVAATEPGLLTAAALSALDRAVITPPQDPTAQFCRGLAAVLAGLGLVEGRVA